MTSHNNTPVLSVNNLSIRFSQYTKGLYRRELEVITSLNVDIHERELVAVVGSSGSGKSLLAHAVMGILPSNAVVSGSIMYQGQQLTSESLKKLRGNEISLIPQSVTYLDPLMKVGKQIKGLHASDKKVSDILKRYRLDPDVADMYPYQLSGGMIRRVLVATAVITGAKLIIADEPTPGLSGELAQETLCHLRELANAGCAVMLITHDISAAVKVADSISVFYAGTTVETAQRDDFQENGQSLRHPHTKALWEALPQNGFQAISGRQPYTGTIINSCPFVPRCHYATPECSTCVSMREMRNGRVRCVHAT